MAIVLTDDTYYKDIAQALRDNGASSSAKFKPSQMASVIYSIPPTHYEIGREEGLSAGKLEEYNRFWNSFQKNGKRIGYAYAFGGEGWTEETFKPEYNMKPTNATYMFAKSGIKGSLAELLTKAGVTLDTSNCDNHIRMFAECTGITEVPHIDLTKTDYATSIFEWCIALKKVSLKVAENTFPNCSGWFTKCSALEDVNMDGCLDKSISFVDSPNLTVTSVYSVISCLKDLTGATSQTLTLHADVGNKLPEELRAMITAKNWTLVY